MRSIIRNREQGHAVNQDEGQDAMDVAADEDQDQHLSGENLWCRSSRDNDFKEEITCYPESKLEIETRKNILKNCSQGT